MEHGRAFLTTQVAQRGLTAAALARQFGVSRSYMSLVLNGHRPVTLKLAQAGRRHYPELLTILVNQITAPAVESLEQAS